MKKRKRTSCIWNISIEKLTEVVNKSSSFSDVLRYFNLVIAGGNYKTLKKRLNEENINYSHIPNSNKNRKFPDKPIIPLDQIMVEHSTYSRKSLKERLLKNNMIENKCAVCGMLPRWNNQNLVLIIDHINGINDDNRLENLRLLCPNCNSQQKTFCGKNKRKRYYCKECGEQKKSKYGKFCTKCGSLTQRKVKERPSKEKLLKEVEETNCCAVGRKYGVSDNAIRKWIGIKK